jgi:outer membrane protein TolC
MPGLFSSPSDNAAQAAQTTASADNAEIGQEEQYVNAAEGQLRSAIAGLGPNPYFSGGTPPAPVSVSNTTNFQNTGASGTYSPPSPNGGATALSNNGKTKPGAASGGSGSAGSIASGATTAANVFGNNGKQPTSGGTASPQPVARAPVSGAPVQTAAISRQQGPAAS